MAKSYSQVSLYEKCPFAYHCKYKQKLSEPTSTALERGILVHDQIDEYLQGKRKKVPDMHKVSQQLIRDFKKLDAESEQFWHFDNKWNFVDDWDWLVVKMDASCIPSNGVLRLADWKTGNRYPTHKEQLHLYATAGFSTYDCHTIEAIAAYVDYGNICMYKWNEDEYERMKAHWNQRIGRLENEKQWQMNPGHHCRWCNFGKSKRGPCSYG